MSNNEEDINYDEQISIDRAKIESMILSSFDSLENKSGMFEEILFAIRIIERKLVELEGNPQVDSDRYTEMEIRQVLETMIERGDVSISGLNLDWMNEIFSLQELPLIPEFEEKEEYEQKEKYEQKEERESFMKQLKKKNEYPLRKIFPQPQEGDQFRNISNDKIYKIIKVLENYEYQVKQGVEKSKIKWNPAIVNENFVPIFIPYVNEKIIKNLTGLFSSSKPFTQKELIQIKTILSKRPKLTDNKGMLFWHSLVKNFGEIFKHTENTMDIYNKTLDLRNIMPSVFQDTKDGEHFEYINFSQFYDEHLITSYFYILEIDYRNIHKLIENIQDIYNSTNDDIFYKFLNFILNQVDNRYSIKIYNKLGLKILKKFYFNKLLKQFITKYNYFEWGGTITSDIKDFITNIIHSKLHFIKNNNNKKHHILFYCKNIDLFNLILETIGEEQVREIEISDFEFNYFLDYNFKQLSFFLKAGGKIPTLINNKNILKT